MYILHGHTVIIFMSAHMNTHAHTSTRMHTCTYVCTYIISLYSQPIVMVLSDVLRGTEKEKVKRIVLATLRVRMYIA